MIYLWSRSRSFWQAITWCTEMKIKDFEVNCSKGVNITFSLEWTHQNVGQLGHFCHFWMGVGLIFDLPQVLGLSQAQNKMWFGKAIDRPFQWYHKLSDISFYRGSWLWNIILQIPKSPKIWLFSYFWYFWHFPCVSINVWSSL